VSPRLGGDRWPLSRSGVTAPSVSLRAEAKKGEIKLKDRLKTTTVKGDRRDYAGKTCESGTTIC
jgi:hypothetical protein